MQTDELRQKLRRFILTELIRNPEYPLEDDEPLVSGGLIDSFGIAQLAVFFEKEFNIHIPDSELVHLDLDSIHAILRRLATEN